MEDQHWFDFLNDQEDDDSEMRIRMIEEGFQIDFVDFYEFDGMDFRHIPNELAQAMMTQIFMQFIYHWAPTALKDDWIEALVDMREEVQKQLNNCNYNRLVNKGE